MRTRRVVALGLGLALAGAALGLSAAPARSGDAPALRTVGGAAATRVPRFRHIVNAGTHAADARAAAARGWNLLDVSSKEAADALPRGTRAVVWVGDYDNSSCSWQLPDSKLTTEARAMKGDRKIAGFYISDEPDPFACPNAPAQHAARTRLLHRLAPGTFTLMVADSNSGGDTLRQLPLWRGAADYVGLDPYPCYQGKPCDFTWIDTVIRTADRAGLSYWGMVQAFDDTTWRWPTGAEEQHMLQQWAASHESGMSTFAWRWAGATLPGRADVLGALTAFNLAGRAAPSPARSVADGATSRTAAAPTAAAPSGTADEIHYTYTGPTSVAFDWRGTAKVIRYGRTRAYTAKVAGRPPSPMPFSSSGPYWQARITGLKPGKTYHYSIGSGPDAVFSTAPTGPFRVDVIADVGASGDWDGVAPTQRQIAADRPAFVLMVGDLTYGNDNTQKSVDQHFDDVMAWSKRAAYMPAWGNHEWDKSSDDLRNYKGRFALPHPQASPGAPSAGCCGSDWSWFDAGGVRFISYPEPYTDATWADWKTKATPIFASAQANPAIHFIVTFGHRPAYSTGYHSGDDTLAGILDGFGDTYSKYVLNLNGHSHDYERFKPIHGVVHVTAAGGGSDLEDWSSGKDPRDAYRAMHLEHVRIDVTASALKLQAVCGPSTSHDQMSCQPGQVIDSVTIGPRASAS